MTTNKASWSIENSLFLGIAVFVASIYFTYPTDEDWIPLDIGLSQSTYFDRNSLQWSGNVVTMATKYINSNGTAITDAKWTIDGKMPQGLKMDIVLDCQQRRVQLAGMSVFLKEGDYAAVQPEGKDKVNPVLDPRQNEDIALLGLCDSERPSWHLHRYKWFREKARSLFGYKS